MLRVAVTHLHRSHTATGPPASGGLRYGRVYCPLGAGLTKAEKLLSRERAGVQAGLTLLSSSMQPVRRKNSFKLLKLTLFNFFFLSLENTSREILNTSLFGFIGICI